MLHPPPPQSLFLATLLALAAGIVVVRGSRAQTAPTPPAAERSDVQPPTRQLQTEIDALRTQMTDLRHRLDDLANDAGQARSAHALLERGLDGRFLALRNDLADLNEAVAGADALIAEAQSDIRAMENHTHLFTTPVIRVHSDGTFRDVQYSVAATFAPQ